MGIDCTLSFDDKYVSLNRIWEFHENFSGPDRMTRPEALKRLSKQAKLMRSARKGKIKVLASNPDRALFWIDRVRRYLYRYKPSQVSIIADHEEEICGVPFLCCRKYLSKELYVIKHVDYMCTCSPCDKKAEPVKRMLPISSIAKLRRTKVLTTEEMQEMLTCPAK